MWSCSLLFRCRSFLPWWPLAFLIFSQLLKNFHVILQTKLVSFVFLSLALAPFLLSTQMKTLKLSRRKESASLLLFFISKKSWNSYAIYSRYAGVRLEMQNFTPELHETVDVRTDVLRTDDFLRTKISWMHSLPNFFTHGAPLRALREQELRYKN